MLGLVDWRIATFFSGGRMLGGFTGTLAARRPGEARGRLTVIFADFVILTGLFVLRKALGTSLP